MEEKKIIVAITGSIAAYKAASLVRLLVKEGAVVKVVMTPFAKNFIAPLTMATLSQSPIACDFFDSKDGDWHSHVEMGLWADLMIVAPASANSLAKMANGIADNLLVATYLSAKCPVYIAPAMDLDMYKHPANQQNITKLRYYGNRIVEPKSGELASGLCGKGRMEEPEIIVEHTKQLFANETKLKDKTFLVTAGPTHEQVDPVRFIGNYSTGKMGFAIAESLAKRGAKIILISGPVNINVANSNIERIDVKSAEEMYQACKKVFSSTDGAVLCAAVADFTPAKRHAEKVKRHGENLLIELTPTKDIAAELGNAKRQDQLMVGFALETNDEEQNAMRKIERKKLDFIVLNSLRDTGAGFGHDTNKISIIDKNNNIQKFELKHKTEVAEDIANTITAAIEVEKKNN